MRIATSSEFVKLFQLFNSLNNAVFSLVSLAKRERMMKFALTCFKDQLKLESEAILEGKVEIRDIPRGFRIMEEDSLKDAALVLVIDGCFSVCQKNEEGREQELHQCYAGGLLGQLQVMRL